MHGLRSTCRNWAAAIVDAHPNLDVMLVESTMTGHLTTVLLPPAEDSFPASPRGAEPLNAPVILTGIVDATEQINYDPTRRTLSVAGIRAWRAKPQER
ncbi:MAG: hypothetical protein WCG47_11475 [Dermatophilaceae bacterium]